jgi:hypothetical protein
MIVAKVPIPVIAQLVGWSATTMYEMAEQYGHFSQDELRKAAETISGGNNAPRHFPRHFPAPALKPPVSN